MLRGPTGESNDLRLAGRGPFVCVSPWNFPLAIFVGQVAAAYAAGNAVVAKPAEQTPLVAFRADASSCSKRAFPADAIALPARARRGGGRAGSSPIRASPAWRSPAPPRRRSAINRALAARDGPIVPFIAETGGLNAMLVDSSALPEQVVTDVIASAFNSAGQRCSALRVLCLQKEIAPRVLALLEGATAELRAGRPRAAGERRGPGDRPRGARRCCEAHARAHGPRGAAGLQGAAARGADRAPSSRRAPTRSPGWRRSTEEIFGPILHVVTFESDELGDVIDAINAKGFGLTLGVHSRIEETVEFVRRRARAGNVYVNRNMIGATVGVQPFGGEGLSGTGPKAGGPHYLFRFATERTFTVNTAAAGGNAALIAGSE